MKMKYEFDEVQASLRQGKMLCAFKSLIDKTLH